MNDVRAVEYYSWEGDPCRVVEDESRAEGLRAEIYVSGEGFLPVNMEELRYKAAPIGEARFKELVMEAIRLAKAENR